MTITHYGTNSTSTLIPSRVWSGWIDSSTTSTTSSLYSDLTWTNWTQSASTSSTSGTITWSNWSANAIPTIYSSSNSTSATWNNWIDYKTIEHVATYQRETEEQRQHRLDEWEKQDKIRKEARSIAIGKADALLASVLNDAQKAQLKQKDWFLVRSQSGKLYRIRNCRQINVDLIDERTGRVKDTYCAHPTLNVPNGDTLTGQKLMLQFDEKAFLKIAIKHRPNNTPVPLELIN